MKYVASLSCGKDSLAMVLRLMQEHKPLDYVVMYDAGMEFDSIYRNREKISVAIREYGAEMVILKPENSFLKSLDDEYTQYVGIAIWQNGR